MLLQIQKISKEKNKSIAALSRETKVQRKFIYMYDKGQIIPRLDTACRIAKALNVPLQELIKEES